jgi:hypothetical protein
MASRVSGILSYESEQWLWLVESSQSDLLSTYLTISNYYTSTIRITNITRISETLFWTNKRGAPERFSLMDFDVFREFVAGFSVLA